eukprot:CCRYP_001508-RA/>CCRYP_001508-RA protein AED:0.44 eAED:0.44 QI:39/1/0.5/1/1/0.5/2/0/70
MAEDDNDKKRKEPRGESQIESQLQQLFQQFQAQQQQQFQQLQQSLSVQIKTIDHRTHKIEEALNRLIKEM